jgi:H+/Cl- antiporter ClcA
MKNFNIFIKPLIIALCLGMLADIISMPDNSNSTFAFGFFIIIPLAVTLLILFLRFFKFKKRLIFVLSSTLAFFLAMFFTFWFYEMRRGGYVSDMYGLFYIFGFIPSLAIGSIFGLFLHNHFKKYITFP